MSLKESFISSLNHIQVNDKKIKKNKEYDEHSDLTLSPSSEDTKYDINNYNTNDMINNIQTYEKKIFFLYRFIIFVSIASLSVDFLYLFIFLMVYVTDSVYIGIFIFTVLAQAGFLVTLIYFYKHYKSCLKILQLTI